MANNDSPINFILKILLVFSCAFWFGRLFVGNNERVDDTDEQIKNAYEHIQNLPISDTVNFANDALRKFRG